ncbi:MAG: dTMP kinase [Patescibacteria group bacterium]|nr:dTMP kinase [Patescibacteria group bacterium]
MERGIFVAFEGIDLCGKSTQKKMLAERLRKTDCFVHETREPGSPLIELTIKIRQLIKEYNMDSRCELALFFADRAQHTQLVMELLRRTGTITLTDRQWASSVAYQIFGRGLFGEERTLEERLADFFVFNDFFSHGIYPHLNILIDVPVEVAQARVRDPKARTRFDNEQINFHQRVRNGYLQLAQKSTKGDWLVFDGTKKAEKLHEDVYQKFVEWLKNKKEEKE